MREFIRHPADVPIQVQSAATSGFEGRSTQNVSFGGLAFASATSIEPDTLIALRVPYLDPAFEVPAARVAWCRHEGNQYVIGVQFPDSEEAFRVRMIEQLLHIENYRVRSRYAMDAGSRPRKPRVPGLRSTQRRFRTRRGYEVRGGAAEGF